MTAGICSACGEPTHAIDGAPWLAYKRLVLCFTCYIDIIPEIYGMAGAGDGGAIHWIFKASLASAHNRQRRVPLKLPAKIRQELFQRYKFSCVHCGEKESKKLTIDHIKPVSKGGSDKVSTLQILCRSCNSKKGASYEVV